METENEVELGYIDGYDDAKKGWHCRFKENHSAYAIGYYSGYSYYKELVKGEQQL